MVRSIFALAAVLSVASTSLAGDLVTSSFFVGSSSFAACNVVNITSSTLTVHPQLFGDNGVVITDLGVVSLSPGTAVAAFGFSPHKAVYCRFVNASKSKVRANIMAGSNNSDGTPTFTAEAH